MMPFNVKFEEPVTELDGWEENGSFEPDVYPEEE